MERKQTGGQEIGFSATVITSRGENAQDFQRSNKMEEESRKFME